MMNLSPTPSLLYFTSFLLFASNGGRFSSLIFPALCPELSQPLLLSTFFILANVSSMVSVPKLVYVYSTSSTATKTQMFTVSVLVATATYVIAFVPALSSAPIQIGLRMLNQVSTSLVSTLGDSLTVKHGHKHGTEFGQARLFGAVSWALMSIVVGYVAEWTSSWAIATIPAALISAILTALTGRAVILDADEEGTDVAYVKVDPETSPENDETLTEDNITPSVAFCRLTATASNSSFLFGVFALATGMSIVESLSFEYFTNSLHAKPSLNGMTVLITVVFEIPLFHYAGTLENRVGFKTLQLGAMLAYSSRVIGYTLVPKAWMVLLLEPLHGVTYALGTTASISFVKKYCDGAVGQGVVNVIRGNIGPLLGLLLYGVIAQLFNEDAVYRGLGLLVFIASFALKATSDANTTNPTEGIELASLEI